MIAGIKISKFQCTTDTSYKISSSVLMFGSVKDSVAWLGYPCKCTSIDNYQMWNMRSIISLIRLNYQMSRVLCESNFVNHVSSMQLILVWIFMFKRQRNISFCPWNHITKVPLTTYDCYQSTWGSVIFAYFTWITKDGKFFFSELHNILTIIGWRFLCSKDSMCGTLL